MLAEMAIADAYAIAFEFTDHTPDRPWDLTQYWQHPKYAEMIPGQYTDDTKRAIANVRNMLNGAPFSPVNYATEYLWAYEHLGPEGYSKRYGEFLGSVTSPMDFLLKVNRQAISNGAVMGAAPLGYLQDPNAVKLAASVQALTTHHADTAIHAQLVALAAHHFIYSGDKADLRPFLMDMADWVTGSDDPYRWAFLIDNHSQGRKTTIRASSISSYMVWALESFETMSEIITDACSRGGDTDSAAAVTIAVASCCPEIINDLPDVLKDGLHNGDYGLDYLIGLEDNLKEIV